MKALMTKIALLDPALLRGAIMAGVWFLASIGIVVSPDVPNSLIGVLAALLAIVQAVWTRPAVTPNAKVATWAPDPINAPQAIVNGPAAIAGVPNASSDSTQN